LENKKIRKHPAMLERVTPIGVRSKAPRRSPKPKNNEKKKEEKGVTVLYKDARRKKNWEKRNSLVSYSRDGHDKWRRALHQESTPYKEARKVQHATKKKGEGDES